MSGMEILIFLNIMLGAYAIYQKIMRSAIEEEKQKILSDMEQTLNAINKAKETGTITHMRSSNNLVRAFFSEYLKLFMQERLHRRIWEKRVPLLKQDKNQE